VLKLKILNTKSMEISLLTKSVIDILRKYADDLESGNTHISSEDGLELIS
jgi:hypothetical protein